MLTRRGYAVPKEGLAADKITKIMKELNVAPAVPMQAKRFGSPPTFRIFAESLTQYYLPRVWATEVFGPATKTTLTSGQPLRPELVFTGTPYDYQKAIVDTFVAAGNGLICVPCGRGKTFMAIMIAAKLGHKFMIIVDKEFLLDQWMGELKSLLPGLRVGILQGDTKQLGAIERKPLTADELKAELRKAGLPVTGTKTVLLQRLRAVVPEEPVQNYDCCIAMIQTLSQREYGHDEFQDFGLTIFDECHHLGAEHFSRALLKVQTKWMLGLSATPTRDDGLSKVFEWFIGKAVYWEKTREADPDVIVQRVGFSSDDPAYAEVPVDARGEPVLARLLGQVVGCEERNVLIDGILRKVLEEPLRKILVLSERKEHLHRINANLPPGTTSSYYIGGMDSDTRQNGAATARVLLGTYAMASEAMNVKTLNTMIMISPRKKIEQSTGRILRTQKDAREIPPLIIDMVDAHGVYQGQWGKRKVYYKKCAYKIQDVVGDYELPKAGSLPVKPEPKASSGTDSSGITDISGIPTRYMFED